MNNHARQDEPAGRIIYPKDIIVLLYLKAVAEGLYSKRSTAEEGTYKGNVSGSQAEYCFHWHGSSPDLFLFEAPIDMLSYITMLGLSWERHSYGAACSVSDRVLLQMLKDNPNIHNVYIAFDNDEAVQDSLLVISVY